MIYFITNKKEKYDKLIDSVLFSDIKILKEEEGIKLYNNKFKDTTYLHLDIEATGLDCHKSSILLLGVSKDDNYFMFDWTIDFKSVIKLIEDNNMTIVGHNLKYDIKLIYKATNILLKKVYDVMLADQRLYKGAGYKWGYADIVGRYTNEVIEKGTRDDFIDADKSTFIIKTSHLYYLKKDLIHFKTIVKAQVKKIKKFNMEFLLYNIEFPLVAVLAQSEYFGIGFNKDKWIQRYKDDINYEYDLLCKLDKILINLRETVNNKKTIYIKGGKYDNKRIKNPEYDIFKKDGSTTIKGLFGEMLTKKQLTGTKNKIKKYPNNLNYTKTEIVTIFAALEVPMITTFETFSIPVLKNGKIEGSIHTYTVKSDYLKKYLILRPDTIMREFIETYLELAKTKKAINTYGESFINNINPLTGRIHTIFRQDFANTGRLQSGGGKKEPDKINCQNIPKENKYRNCFTTDITKYSLMTADYQGAELIIMCSKAQDNKLLALSKEDMHSYMSTKSWRSIYKFRYNKLRADISNHKDKNLIEHIKDQLNKYLKLSKEFIVTASEPKNFRQNFKPMTFGVIYGMYSKKAGQTLGTNKEEGQIVINTIERELPDTINLVKGFSNFAEDNGYLILNKRTNSRRWFPALLKQLKGEYNKKYNFLDISNDLSAARNAPIQGTQADFIKEAGVVLQYYYWEHDIDARILLSIHDEFVIELPRHLDGYSQEFKDNNNKQLFTFNGKEFDNLATLSEYIMIDTANKYLNKIEIKVDYKVLDTWFK